MKYILLESQLKKMFEQSERALEPLVVKLFKFLNEEKKGKTKRSEILNQIKNVAPYLGLPEGYEIYFLEMFLLNYRPDGDYSSLTKENFVDPKKMKGKWTPNTKADLYTKAQLPFRGSNIEGYWTEDTKGVPYYVVKSYDWYPIYIFKDNRWYEVVERYSSSTGRQMSNANPVEWNDELSSKVILATKDEMKLLERGATYEDIIKHKKKKLKELEPELKSKRVSRKTHWGGWDEDTDVRLPDFIVKFKVNSIEEGEDKMTVVVDIFDVLKKEGNKGIETPENYLKGELEGITPQKVERAVENKLKQDLRPYIGPRYQYYEPLPDNSNIKFRFNHLKK